MGKIIVSENVSVDGVFQDPTGEEGTGRGHWFAGIGDEDRAAWAKALSDETQGAEALLLGRRSYGYFAARYPSRTGEWPDKLNAMPKYVVSTTLHDPGWNNSTVLAGDAVEEARALKSKVDGDIVVYASSRLVRTLLDHDLVDELRLMVCPLLRGIGGHLFAETDDQKPLRLLDTRVVGDSFALLTYQPT